MVTSRSRTREMVLRIAWRAIAAKVSKGRPQSPLVVSAETKPHAAKQTTCRSGDCEGVKGATAKPPCRSRRSEIPLHNHAHHAEMLQKHNDTFAE